jgi:MFS family permease
MIPSMVSARPPRPARLGYLGLLRSPAVLGLWVAQAQSVFGDRLYALAMMWLVWQVTHSAFLMGLAAVVESVPYVVAGMSCRRLLAWFGSLGRLAMVDAARAVVVAVVPLAWGSGYRLPVLLVAAAVLGCLGAVFDPNLAAFVPELADPQRVQQVMGLMDLTGRLARVAGPASAGLLLMVVPVVGLYGVDAVTFAVSAGLMVCLARRGRLGTRAAARVPRSVGPRARVLLRSDVRLFAAIGMHGAGVMASTLPAIAMPVLLAVRLHASARGYGLVLAAAGLGALAGNPLVGNLRLSSRFPVAYFGAWVAAGAVLAATGQAGSVPVVAVLGFAGGIAAPVSAVCLSTYLSRNYPRPERLQLAAADQAVIRACGTCGMLVLPALAAAHPSAGFTAAGLVTMTLAVAGLAVVPRLPARTVPRAVTEHDPAVRAGTAAA